MNLEDLLKHTEVAMDAAKKSLLEEGKVLPLLVMIKGENQPIIMSPVPDKGILPHILRKENPRAFVWSYEAWIRPPGTDERREAIQSVGGMDITRVMIDQEFSREDGKIMFGGKRILRDNELDCRIMNNGLYDPVFGEIMGLWAVAPTGGRTYCLPTSSLRVWVPEGWKTAKETDDRDGKPRPIFFREGNPHGALRISTMWPTTARPYDFGSEARAALTHRRSMERVESELIEEKQDRIIVSWSQISQEPGQRHPTKAHAWWIYDQTGLIILTFAYSTSTNSIEVSDELAAARAIVRRIERPEKLEVE